MRVTKWRTLVATLLATASAWPTKAPPPPLRLYQTVPPPPSPPPGLVASFDAERSYAVAILGTPWRSGQSVTPKAGVLVAQQLGDAVHIYGVLSGLSPSTGLTLSAFSSGCPLSRVPADERRGGAFVVGADGTVTVEVLQALELSAASADVLARSGFIGVYSDGGEQLLCGKLASEPHTQLILLGRMPAQFSERTATGLALLRRTAHAGSSRMSVRGIVRGLEPSFAGMWHFHRGFNGRDAVEDLRFYEGIYAGYRTGRSTVRGGDGWTYGVREQYNGVTRTY